MRLALALAVVVAVLAAPASAALDPGTLVLRQADMPSGFQLDESSSGPITNARRSREDPRISSGLIVRSGRLTGYDAVYVSPRPLAQLESLADVFRTSQGARMVFLWFDRAIRRDTPALLKRTEMEIGDQGWLYRGSKSEKFALVIWREGRVFAAVFGLGVAADTTLALARTQERRIASAIR